MVRENPYHSPPSNLAVLIFLIIAALVLIGWLGSLPVL